MKRFLLTCMVALGVGAYAQVGPPLAANPNTNNGYGFVQTNGTYTPLSSSRTVWQSGATLATNAVSPAVSLPFTFKYNGKSYTNIYINNNGYLTFGSPSTATTYTGLSTDLTSAGNIYEGAIAGFAVNLRNANTTTSEIAYETVGSKFIVQFTDLQGNSASTAQTISFQIQLDSSNNTVAIIYGTCVSGTGTLTGEVGLKGAESSDVNNRTGTNWTTSAIGTSNSSTMTLGTSGAATIPASGLTFTFTPGTWLNAPTSYATIPFTEAFGSWVNGNSTADLPNATYWRTWPSRGDNSWRASDISTSGFTSTSGWSSTSGGATIAAPAVAPTARFHSYNTVGVSGYMDLYVNLSTGGAGNRVISFDYINTSGTDKLDVLLSTDGGVTFNSLGGSLGVAAAWANKTFTTSSTSSTAILRFLGTGDNGSTDIQIDNLAITVSTAPPVCTTISSPANAATGISINPAISWNSASLATSYLVSIGTTAGGTNVMNAVDVGNVNSYTIPAGTPLNYSTQYYITISPKNAYGTASGCTETSFTTSVIPCPSVTAPTAAAIDVSTSAMITWSAVPGATGYKLTVGTTTGGTDVLNSQDLGNNLSYTFSTPLNAATKYYYKVNAYSSTSTSVSCSERSFTTACATVAAFSENFDTTAANSLPVCWTNLGSTGGAYAQASTVIGAPNNLYIYTDTSTTGFVALPSVSTLQSGTYRLKFSARANLTAGGIVGIGYIDSSNNFVQLTTYTTTSTNTIDNFVYNIPALPAGVTRLAFKHSGTPAYSALIDNVVYELIPSCLEPSALVVNSFTANSAVVSWTAPATTPANGYQVYYSTTNTAPTSSTVLNATNSVTSTTATANIPGLSPNTVYYIWVRSSCSSTDNSVWVGSVSVYTGYCLPSTTNQNSWISEFTSTGATTNMAYSSTVGGTGGYQNLAANLKISNYAGSVTPITLTGGGPTVGFAVWIDWNNNLSFESSERVYVTTAYTTTTSGATITVPAATALGNYRMRVVANYNNSAPSNPCEAFTRGEYIDFTFEVIAQPACVVPAGLTASSVTSNTATISWTAPTPAPANGYEYYYSTTNSTPNSGTVITGTSQPLTLLAPLTTYYYWVRSVCSSSSVSTWVTGSFTTLATPPANDNCSSATVLTPGLNFAQNPLTGTTVGSTNTPALTASCLFTPTNVGGNVWYTVVVPASGSLTIETAAVTGSPLTDTVLSVFANCSSTTSIGCDDDSGVDSFSKLSLTGQTPGSTLYVSVWRYSTATDGAFQISAYDASLSTSESVKTKNDIKAYPNPFVDVLNISDVSNVKSISVVDISGKLVKSFDKAESVLHLGGLNSGMYLVILNMKDGSKQTIKAIKK